MKLHTDARGAWKRSLSSSSGGVEAPFPYRQTGEKQQVGRPEGRWPAKDAGASRWFPLWAARQSESEALQPSELEPPAPAAAGAPPLGTAAAPALALALG